MWCLPRARPRGLNGSLLALLFSGGGTIGIKRIRKSLGYREPIFASMESILMAKSIASLRASPFKPKYYIDEERWFREKMLYKMKLSLENRKLINGEV